MALGQITFKDLVGQMPSAPTFSDVIKFLGDSAYSAGGTAGFQALFNALTRDKRKPLAVIAQDCGGYLVSYNEVAGQALSGAGTFALVDGQTLTFLIDAPASPSSGTNPPVLTMTFHANQFANIAAATATEVVNAINQFFASLPPQDPQAPYPNVAQAVASVSSSTHVLVQSSSVGLGSNVTIGGTAAATFVFVGTAGTDKLKVWMVDTSDASAPLIENTTADLSGVTFNVLVLSK